MTFVAWKALQDTWISIKQAMLGFDEEEYTPIHREDGKWWFWDECWCTKYGPFDSREEAQMGLNQYVKHYL